MLIFNYWFEPKEARLKYLKRRLAVPFDGSVMAHQVCNCLSLLHSHTFTILNIEWPQILFQQLGPEAPLPFHVGIVTVIRMYRLEIRMEICFFKTWFLRQIIFISKFYSGILDNLPSKVCFDSIRLKYFVQGTLENSNCPFLVTWSFS